MKLTNKTILILILIVASLLRFYNYFEIPYMHDEFSALFRSQFNSFGELIEKGVKTDTHPAGIQIFIYYWIKLFGSETWIVKLPFTLFGIAAIYLSFVVAKKWFNESVGLFSAAFFASTQFMIMYSQIARPYVSGLFFSLFMVNFFTDLIKNPSFRFYWNAFFFVVSACFCTYNHHFSMLFAAIVVLSGLFLIDRKYLVRYLLSGMMIILLYLPHLKIFFIQLAMGGVEDWLAKPQNDFIIQFLYYCCNFSFWSILSVIVIFSVSIYQSKRYKIDKSTFFLFSTWFWLPFLIGFLYSRYVNSLLQYSLLIFSFPYFVFLVFGNFKNQKSYINLIIVFVILSVNSLSLIFERQHYKLFYLSQYKEVLFDYQKSKNESKNGIFLISSHKKIIRYCASQLHIDTNFVWLDFFKTELELIKFLEANTQKESLYLGAGSGIEPNYIPIILDYYPVIKWQKNYIGSTSYLFTKGEAIKNNPIEILNLMKPSAHWSTVNLNKCIDSLNAYLMDEETEYSPTYTNNLKEIVKNKNNFIDVSVKIKRLDNKKQEIILASAFDKKDKSIYWGAIPYSNFERADKEWVTIHHSIKLSDIVINYNNVQLKVFVWNKGKTSFLIKDFKILLREGNPIIYGFNSKL